MKRFPHRVSFFRLFRWHRKKLDIPRKAWLTPSLQIIDVFILAKHQILTVLWFTNDITLRFSK